MKVRMLCNYILPDMMI